MMTDKQAGDPEPPGSTDPGLAQPADEDTSAYSQDPELAAASGSTGDPEPPGNTGDPEPPGDSGGT
jgi:hypothetical protein